MTPKIPLDRFPYPKHPTSRLFGPDLPAGNYVFVQAADGGVWVLLETEGHLHPRVLGDANPALGAGGLRMGTGGVVLEVDNFSGTFQFDAEILLCVLGALRSQGGYVDSTREVEFDHN